MPPEYVAAGVAAVPRIVAIVARNATIVGVLVLRAEVVVDTGSKYDISDSGVSGDVKRNHRSLEKILMQRRIVREARGASERFVRFLVSI